MKIQSLHYYPVKSLAGISCDQFKLDTKGPEYDRRYMLVNAAGQFITQRQFGQLALLTLHLTDSGFRVTQPSGESITIPFIGEQQKAVPSKIWSDEIELFEQPPLFNAFFSDYLGLAVRLVYQAASSVRVQEKATFKTVSLADGFPLLMINQASIDDINQRFALSLSPVHFRANIVIKGAQAFVEDNWQGLQCGEHRLHAVKPCSRCVIPTIDIATGKPQKAVWQALKSARQDEDGQIYFGHNLVHTKLATLSIHDKIAPF